MKSHPEYDAERFPAALGGKPEIEEADRERSALNIGGGFYRNLEPGIFHDAETSP